jgi:hypothetical protein
MSLGALMVNLSSFGANAARRFDVPVEVAASKEKIQR